MLDGVLSCLVERHDWRIAAFAILACVFSLGIALLLSERARRLSPRARRAYTLSAPLVGGLGVWTTHFIAMLSYDIGVEVRYDALQTFLSLVIVAAAFWIDSSEWKANWVVSARVRPGRTPLTRIL